MTEPEVILDIKTRIEDETAISGITHQELAQILVNIINTNPLKGENDGMFLRNRVETNYGTLGNAAIDLSYSGSPSTTKGATGQGAFAFGTEITASGYSSIAIGSIIDTSAICDFNAGINLRNRGYSNALFGTGHDIKGMNILVAGQAAEIEDLQSLDYNASSKDKPLFIIGNGTIANNDPDFTVLSRSNAFKVYMDGKVLAPSLSNSLIEADTTGKMLITKEYLEYVLNLNNGPIMTESL